MPWWSWSCAIVFGAAVLAALVALVASLARLGRAAQQLERSITPLAERLERASTELEVRTAALTRDQERLATARVRASAAFHDVTVLWRALDQVRTGVRLLRLGLRAR